MLAALLMVFAAVISSETTGGENIAGLLKLAAKTRDHAPDKCIEYCRRVITLSTRSNDLESKAKAHMHLNYAYTVKSEMDQSLKHAKAALAIYEKLGHRRGMAAAMNSLGLYYVNIDYYDIAQDYLLQALKIREELGEKEPLYTSYLYMGILYYNLKEFNKGMAYFRKALSLARVLKVKRNM